MSAPRLSSATKDAILADYVAGMKVVSIALKYGVDASYPSLLARRRKAAPRRPNHASKLMARGQ